MTRGGRREGAGGKYKWKNGRTKVVRIPESLEKEILDFAMALDALEGFDSVTHSACDDVTRSKMIDLTGVLVRSFNGNPCVYLADLLRVGYSIYPEELAESVKLKSEREKNQRVDDLKSVVQQSLEQLTIL
jgi:hypothetical protein